MGPSCAIHKRNATLDTDLKQRSLVIEATRKGCKYDPEIHTYRRPSRATPIGYGLKYGVRLVQGQGIKEENMQKEEKARRFLSLHFMRWNGRISSIARRSLQPSWLNKPLMLPTANDIVQFNSYLKTRAKKLQQEEDTGYEELTTICLAQVILFNGKRSGEASRILKTSFLNPQKGSAINQQVSSLLSRLEIELAKIHTQVKMQGKSKKRGSKVAILLTDQMVDNINAPPQKTGRGQHHLRFPVYKTGHKSPIFQSAQLFDKMCFGLWVQKSSFIQSIHLHKQLTVVMQVLHLSQNGQDILADFMTHDLLIHRNFYWLPEDTLQMAKVTKVLHAISEGTLGHLKGKDFDSIGFNAQGRWQVYSGVRSPWFILKITYYYISAV